MFAKTLLGASLSLVPAVSLAQATPSFYVGAAVNLSTLNPLRYYNTNPFGPALTVGYQLSPRWAIQTGASWNRRSNTSTANLAVFTDPAGANIYNRITYDTRYTLLVVPLLARFTLTNPTKPLQVDALFGPSWLRSTTRYSTTYEYAAGGSDSDFADYPKNSISAGIGPSLRYAVGAHLELTANSLLQAEFGDGFYNDNRRFSDRLFVTAQLGVQYRFGQ